MLRCTIHDMNSGTKLASLLTVSHSGRAKPLRQGFHPQVECIDCGEHDGPGQIRRARRDTRLESPIPIFALAVLAASYR